MYIKDLYDIRQLSDFDRFKDKEFFCIVHFVSTTEYSPPYDRDDSYTSNTVTRIQQYVTDKQEILEQAIIRLTKDEAKFVVYKTKLASFKINTTVIL